MSYLTTEQIDEQEHFSEKRLYTLVPKLNWNECKPSRPLISLVDLMNWSKDNFSKFLNIKDYENVNCYIHNKIVIDGSFMLFCEENNIKIECLLRDSAVSWPSETHKHEHFMVQGVFLIKCDDFEFIQNSLFSLGNQLESEVSFFVLVSDYHFKKYLEFRNKYEKWVDERDRNQLQITVIGGENYNYEQNASWDDLFLPEQLKNEIKNSVEGFLNAKHIYEKLKIPWKKGILLWGNVGCGKSSLIKTIISNYNFKPVTVQAGSQLNDDSIIEAFVYAQRQKPGLLYIEDLDSLLESHIITLSHFLNLMDGVASKSGIMVICTANNLSNMKESIVDRPSRFDKKIEIPLPDVEMSIKYLKKWFGEALKPKELKEIAKKAVESNFSYAYLKELFLSSTFNALAENRENISLKDIQVATKQMLRDKEIARSGFELSSEEKIGI